LKIWSQNLDQLSIHLLNEVSCQEIIGNSLLILRTSKDSKKNIKAAKDLFNIDLPQALQMTMTDSNLKCFWVSPDEFWVLLGTHQVKEIEEKSNNLPLGVSITNNSAAYGTLEFKGDKTIALLSRWMSYDLEEALPDGKAVSTTFGQAPVFIYREKKSIYMLVRHSFSHYVAGLIKDTPALKEFRLNNYGKMRAMDKVNFISMEDGTLEEYAFLDELENQYVKDLPLRLIDALKSLDSSLSGYQISRLEHSLQGATRAFLAGEDLEMVMAVLFHDIGDPLAPYSHSEMAAAILRPFVSDKIYWVIKHHGVFQMYYYAHHSGGDRNAREAFIDNPWYDDAVKFCHDYDQNCFDPNYESKPLEFFLPMINEFFSRPKLDDPERVARYGKE